MFGTLVPMAVPEQSWSHRPWQVLDILQSLQHPKARPDAGVVDDEVELRPVRRRFHDIVRVPVIRCVVWTAGLRPTCRQTLVDADVEEARVFSELVFVLSDDCIGRIGDRLIV